MNCWLKFSKEGLKAIGLRYFNVYGVGQTRVFAGVITQFLRRIKEKKPDNFWWWLTNQRFYSVEDVAEADLAAMNRNLDYEIFNVGSGIPTSILNLAKLMIKISQEGVEPKFEPALEGDVQYSQADITKIMDKLNWKPKITLEEGIIDLISKTKYKN